MKRRAWPLLVVTPLTAFGCTALLGDFEVTDAISLSEGGANEAGGQGPGSDGAGGGDGSALVDAPSGDAPGTRTHLVNVKAVTAGERHTCALTTGSDVFCWGDNSEGQLAAPAATTRSSHPVKVTGLPTDLKAIVAGPFHTCVGTGNNDLYCWGRNTCGQIGTGDTVSPVREPKKTVGAAAGGLRWIAAGLGKDHTCAVESGGQTYCWGCNTGLQCGSIGAGPVAKPANAGTDKGMASLITAGPAYTCIAGAQPTIRCWGTEAHGELGDGPPSGSATASGIPSPFGSAATGISAGGSHACAIDAKRATTCWGDNTFGQLGTLNEGGTNLVPPVERIDKVEASAVVTGAAFTCILSSTDSLVRCFGSNQSGELGRGGQVDNLAHPVTVAVNRPGASTPFRATSLAAGKGHACAVVESTNDVLCWGNGADGQLGDGTEGGGARTISVFVVAPQ